MIDELINDLKNDEGWEPSAYEDSLGYLTIGYGFLIDDRKNGEIPRHIAEDWLRYAAMIRWNGLVSAKPWLNDQPEDVQRSLANMAYQLGVNGVLNFKKMMAHLEIGNRDLAAIEALDSKWASQTPNRAKRVTDLMRG